MKKIVHIAPALPPTISGLGDFCKILADNLEREGLINVFLVRTGSAAKLEDNVRTFEAHTIHDLLTIQRPDIIVLHYVGYGYNRYGLPFYMAQALKKYRKKRNPKLIVFFHELYASSKSILKLPFYTSWLQQRIVKQILSVADKAFTNCTLYSNILRAVTGCKHESDFVECTGLFSNIPEALFDASVPKEEGSLIVFGSLSRRQSVYAHSSFPALLSDLKIHTVYDIGPGGASFLSDATTVITKGALPSLELARYFNKVKYGALNYKPELLGKSGIFSAYAAFGIIPINLNKSCAPLQDSLTYGVNYFDIASLKQMGTHAHLSESVSAWYKTRDERTITEKVRRHL